MELVYLLTAGIPVSIINAYGQWHANKNGVIMIHNLQLATEPPEQIWRRKCGVARQPDSRIL
jgi:hypothetical protein